MSWKSQHDVIIRNTHRYLRASALVLMAIMLLAVAGVVVVTLRVSAASRRPPTTPLPAAGHEYLLVLVTSSNCFACKHPELPAAVGVIRDALYSESRLIAQSVRTIAAVINTDPTDGMRVISGFGRFDEYAFGGDWESSVARHFLFRSEVHRAGTPTVVIGRRDVELGSDRVMRVSPDTILLALVGLEEIRQFASDLRSRWPLPRTLSPSTDTSLTSPRFQ